MIISSILLILKVTESIMCWSAGSDCVVNELLLWLQSQRLTECQWLVEKWICWIQERWIYWTHVLHCAATHAMQRVNMFSFVLLFYTLFNPTGGWCERDKWQWPDGGATYCLSGRLSSAPTEGSTQPKSGPCRGVGGQPHRPLYTVRVMPITSSFNILWVLWNNFCY